MTAPTLSFATPCTTSCCALATRSTRCLPSDSSPALILQCCLRCPGSVAVRPPLSTSGIFPRQGPQRPAVYTSPHSNQQNRSGNRFPLARHQGFLHAPPPFGRLARPQPLSAVQIRPLGLRPRCLGGALWRLITATSQAKLIPPLPPPPTALLRIRMGVNSHMCLCSKRQPANLKYMYSTLLPLSLFGRYHVCLRTHPSISVIPHNGWQIRLSATLRSCPEDM
jgi:hypothetical protein